MGRVDAWADYRELDDNSDAQPAAAADGVAPADDLLPKARLKIKRSKGEVAFQPCKDRGGIDSASCTYGSLWMFCACGYIIPPVELWTPKSATQLHQYIMALWSGHHFKKRKEDFVLGYDNNCNFKPFATNPQRLAHASPLANPRCASHAGARLVCSVDEARWGCMGQHVQILAAGRRAASPPWLTGRG